MALRSICIVLAIIGCGAAWAAEVALVMSTQGRVLRLGEAAPVPVEAFVKLKEGDRIGLEADARLQLVYFENGRQETWSGPGRLELGVGEGKASGLAPAQVRQLPLVMARQLARTPALDSQGRGGVTRLRSVQGTQTLAKLEETYQDLRTRAARDDFAPEAYLLSGLFEARELERVEKLLGELQAEHPKVPEVGLLVSLYKKALKNVREARQ